MSSRKIPKQHLQDTGCEREECKTTDDSTSFVSRFSVRRRLATSAAGACRAENEGPKEHDDHIQDGDRKQRCVACVVSEKLKA